jgi:hypothetical protein
MNEIILNLNAHDEILSATEWSVPYPNVARWLRDS